MMPKILLLLLIMICDFFALPCMLWPYARRKWPPKRFQTFRRVVPEGTILPELLSQKTVSKFQTACAPCDGQSRIRTLRPWDESRNLKLKSLP